MNDINVPLDSTEINCIITAMLIYEAKLNSELTRLIGSGKDLTNHEVCGLTADAKHFARTVDKLKKVVYYQLTCGDKTEPKSKAPHPIIDRAIELMKDKD